MMQTLLGFRNVLRFVVYRWFSNDGLSCETQKRDLLLNFIKTKIKLLGPINICEYMKEVLTCPCIGYYMKGDVFGKSGDFITSPDISQIFGEMISVWVINEWQKLGAPKPLQLVELGPGRGTMMNDVLRVFQKLKVPSEDLSVHFVELSEELSSIQADVCCVSSSEHKGQSFYRSGLTQNSVPVFWYRSIKCIPHHFSCFLAHEFFDALPIHIFEGHFKFYLKGVRISHYYPYNMSQEKPFYGRPSILWKKNSWIHIDCRN